MEKEIEMEKVKDKEKMWEKVKDKVLEKKKETENEKFDEKKKEKETENEKERKREKEKEKVIEIVIEKEKEKEKVLSKLVEDDRRVNLKCEDVDQRMVNVATVLNERQVIERNTTLHCCKIINSYNQTHHNEVRYCKL